MGSAVLIKIICNTGRIIQILLEVVKLLQTIAK